MHMHVQCHWSKIDLHCWLNEQRLKQITIRISHYLTVTWLLLFFYYFFTKLKHKHVGRSQVENWSQRKRNRTDFRRTQVGCPIEIWGVKMIVESYSTDLVSTHRNPPTLLPQCN
jgi:hypothetical protein